MAVGVGFRQTMKFAVERFALYSPMGPPIHPYHDMPHVSHAGYRYPGRAAALVVLLVVRPRPIVILGALPVPAALPAEVLLLRDGGKEGSEGRRDAAVEVAGVGRGAGEETTDGVDGCCCCRLS